jgi:hypothetical protein
LPRHVRFLLLACTGVAIGAVPDGAIKGRVVLESGSRLLSSVVVRIRCGPKSFDERTDSKGKFSFPLAMIRIFAGITEHGNVETISSCEVSTIAAGYQPSTVSIAIPPKTEVRLVLRPLGSGNNLASRTITPLAAKEGLLETRVELAKVR